MSPSDEAELRRLVLAEYHRTHEAMASRCAGKSSFESAALAHEVAKRTRGDGYRATVYRCSFCGLWHVGNHLSKPANERRPKAKIGYEERDAA